MVGRVLGGIATSILYSAFESWLLCEHTKVGHYSHILFILEIHFFLVVSSKLLLPSSRPGSKTNLMVAKLYVHFYAAVIFGCVDDRITNITQKCIKLTIP